MRMRFMLTVLIPMDEGNALVKDRLDGFTDPSILEKSTN